MRYALTGFGCNRSEFSWEPGVFKGSLVYGKGEVTPVEVEITEDVVNDVVDDDDDVDEMLRSMNDEYKIWQPTYSSVASNASTQLVNGGQHALATPASRRVHGTELVVSHSDG
ncbi:hypothetical protein SAMD00023353_3901180 [Rosellinia necatrix]|uniref:Uncharacterized protein n=1 Tax=Rosellinia necatrix TaxID=77044 RepID=A0A1S8A946_ROSNE|nr:hypothetical protein SAMD00023353_3901180 [Rosellinia necatrix]